MPNEKDQVESVVPKSAVATPEQVLEHLKITPKKEKAMKKEQDELLKTYRSRARLSPDERIRARGIELERHHLITGNADGLGEALAMQGRFAEAAEIVVREDLKAEYTEKANALAISDEDCPCDSFYDAGGVLLPNQHVECYRYSERHKGVVPFIRCKVCGVLNARPQLEHLAEQRKVRRASVEAVTTRSGIETRAEEFFKKA